MPLTNHCVKEGFQCGSDSRRPCLIWLTDVAVMEPPATCIYYRYILDRFTGFTIRAINRIITGCRLSVKKC